MSRRHKIKKHLSADELKTKLFEHFDEIGSLDQLKSQLRGELYTTLLRKTTEKKSPKSSRAQDFDKSLLPLQVSNWLVYDHLLRRDYQYSLSTFTSEAKVLSPEKVLTACDILQLFGLESSNPAYKNISKMYVNISDNGSLHSLLLALVKSLLAVSKSDQEINAAAVNESEKINSTLKESGKVFQEFPKSMNETSNFPKFIHFPGLRFIQNNKFSDSSFQEQIESVKLEKEKEVQELRNKLLDELDRLHKTQIELEHEKTEFRRERNHLLNEKEQFQEKKTLLEKEFENNLLKKLRDLEMDFQSQLKLKETEIGSLQKQVLSKNQKFFEYESEIKSYKGRYDDAERDLAEQRQMYKLLQDKYSLLLEENINLQKKFENMTDYSIIKEELNLKVKEVMELEKKMTEDRKSAEIEKQKLTESLKDLQEKLKAQNPVLSQTQKELAFAKESLHREGDVWNKEKKKLEQELHSSKDMYRTVIERLEEQRQDIHDLHKTIHFLHYQISNNVPNRTKPETFDFPSRTISTMQSMNKQIENLKPRSNKFWGDSHQKHREHSLNFITEAKDRIDRLQKEAEAVQDKFSFILSDLPESRQLSYLDQLSTVPKISHRTNYNIPSYSVSSFSSCLPPNHFDNLVKNEMSFLGLKTASDIKRMVSSSSNSSNLFSHGQKKLKFGSTNLLGNFRNEIPIGRSNENNRELFTAYSDDSEVQNRNKCSSNQDECQTVPKTQILGENLQNNKDKELQTSEIELQNSQINHSLTAVLATKADSSNTKSPQNVQSHGLFLANTQNTVLSNANICKENLDIDAELKTKILESDDTAVDANSTVIPLQTFINDPKSKSNSLQNEMETRNTTLIDSISEGITSENASSVIRESTSKELSVPKDHKTINNPIKPTDEASSLSLIVDLDSAWKQRKASLSELSFTDRSFKPINQVENEHLNSRIDTNKENVFSTDTLSQENVEFNNSRTKNVKSGVSDVLWKDELSHSTSLISNTVSVNKHSDLEIINEKESESMLTMTQPDLKQDEMHLSTNDNPESNKIVSDDTDKSYLKENISEKLLGKNIAKTSKETELPCAESASELSEVQLSCGSEQETKEDSDFW